MALSAYEAIRKEIYLAILENLERKDEEDKRFAPVGTAKQVLSDDRLRRFLRSLDEPEERYTLVLPRVTEDKLIERIHDEHLHRFLAVLIFAGCSIHGARAFKKALVSGNNSPALPSLPASREGLSVLFDGDVPDTDKFVANQPVFCTLIIYGGQEQNLHNPDQFRLPYIEQLVIGNGAFGPVFRVKVAKGHFVDRETGTANLAPVILARKDYKLRRHGKRIDILETILSSSPVRCMNIIETLGQLNLDSNIRSVFMPLAIGDLWTFMQAHDEHRPNSIKKRERLIRCAVGLARGLEFLHNGLSSPTGPLACFHRDLTPQHILVYHAHTEPRYIWKISSFEIAQIKTKEPQAKAVDQSAFVGPQDRLSGSDNDCIGYEGTYLAPEAFSGDPAGAEADVWSLGCVLSVLFAYMEDGAAAITQYAEARVNQQGTGIYQTFFVRPKPTGLASLHPAVIRTHRRLVRETTKRDDGEGKILEDALRYLEQHVLQASPARRENAANVVLMLERTAASYEKVRSATPYMMARFVSRDIEPQQSVLMGVKPVPRGVAKEYEKQSWTERLRQILGRRRKRQPDSELESQSTQPSVQHVIPRTNQGRPRPDSMHSMATKKDRVSLSSAPEELAVSEYDVASRATGLIGLDPTATSTTYKSDHIFSTGKDVLASWTDVSELDDSDGTSTIYSDTMSLPESTKDSYALELCEQLIRGISSYEIPNETAQKTFEALPDYLQAFALRFGSCPGTASQARGDIMAFVHKYREYIAETFIDRYEEKAERSKPSERDGMPLEDIMSMWYDRDSQDVDNAGLQDQRMEPWSEEFNPVDLDTNPNHNAPPTADEDKMQLPVTHPEGLDTQLPKLEMYRETITGAVAYQWLLTDISRQFVLMPSGSDVSDIRANILASLPSPRYISRRNAPRPFKLTISMPWDPVGFCNYQEYANDVSEALARAITLTGSRRAAQALTTEQYMCQTWPSSGRDILMSVLDGLRYQFIPDLAKLLSDGTKVASCVAKSASGQATFFLEARGTAYSLAEIGEQLAWIGAALHSSPHLEGVASVRPGIEKLQVIRDNSKDLGAEYLAEVECVFGFKVTAPPSHSSAEVRNGECWQHLFRNPVLVEGFLIARRPSVVGSANGLEIPLNMMAGLAGARVVGSFCGQTILKGFSTMLVPTQQFDRVVVWHLIHNKHGDRVSYLDCLEEPYNVGLLPSGKLQTNRHILGWCTKVKFLAGTEVGKYDVAGTRLPRPRTKGILQQAIISSGQVISGGAPFNMGYKDSPFFVARDGYIRKLKWISKKFVVLWDEDTKRGWLVNGTSALLHLVRASLEEDSKDKFSSEFLFRFDMLKEAPPDAAYTPDSAILVLLNRMNLCLKLYKEGVDFGGIVFKDRVENIFRLLEQAMDHQVNALKACGSSISTAVPRSYLDGWDFRDLATDADPIYPRIATLSPTGMGWVELTRSLNAVTLLGRGFGELLKPAVQVCSQWSALPVDQYHLAVSISDIRDIMNAVGDPTTKPPRLTDDLVWHNTDAILAASGCKCMSEDTDDHADVVQVVLPPGLTEISMMNRTHEVKDGAVVFGFNKTIPWLWKETGKPVYDGPQHTKRPDRPAWSPSQSDSGYGRSTGGESDSLQECSLIESTRSNISTQTNGLSLTEAPLGPIFGTACRLEAYKVGIVCALPLELLAVRALFDVTHAEDMGIQTPSTDSNHYVLGEMGRHKVVAACLPDGVYGTNSAADVAANMRRTFRGVKFALLVGIGGGVPTVANDMRLGDVVVSRPADTDPGVIQYDLGKARENGLFTPSGVLHPPPRLILTAIGKLRSDPHLSKAPLQEYLKEIAACRREYRYPGKQNDKLFYSHYAHVRAQDTCDHCLITQLQHRNYRPESHKGLFHPQIHYGTIASGNSVMRDAKLRDYWARERSVLCFEMEAAGVMNTIPCLVIRGICDYADSHKNKVFQNFAAAAAASYAKLLLTNVKDLEDLDEPVQRTNVDATVADTRKANGLRHALKKRLSFFA